MYHYLGTGLLIGIVFGMPVGAIGALCMQRTMKHGAFAGLITGMASSIADMVYASVGAFGLTFVSDFLLTYQLPIHVIGSILLVVIAVRMLYRKEERNETTETDANGYLAMFLSSFVVAITNPAAIISFIFAFSVFGIYGSLGFMNGGFLLLGVFIGTLFWWGSLVALVCFMKRKLNVEWYGRANKICGCILLMFSIGVMVKTF